MNMHEEIERLKKKYPNDEPIFGWIGSRESAFLAFHFRGIMKTFKGTEKEVKTELAGHLKTL